jgi:FixJ family two-component response regulator
MNTRSAGRRTFIAIVDDDASVRASLQRLCKVLGLDATAYASGHDFMVSLLDGASPPDCLLLDAHMPEMNGMELRQHLLAAGVEIPTILFSGDDGPLLSAQSFGSGVVAYLRKPLGGDELVEAIERAVAGRAPTR